MTDSLPLPEKKLTSAFLKAADIEADTPITIGAPPADTPIVPTDDPLARLVGLHRRIEAEGDTWQSNAEFCSAAIHLLPAVEKMVEELREQLAEQCKSIALLRDMERESCKMIGDQFDQIAALESQLAESRRVAFGEVVGYLNEKAKLHAKESQKYSGGVARYHEQIETTCQACIIGVHELARKEGADG